MYLRETRRTNRDGSMVSYLQLAHNERHPVSGNPVAKVIHNFGRADKVDRDALARLVASISRFLTPEQAAAAHGGGEVEVLTPAAWAGRGCWTGCGNGSGSARRCARSPPGAARTRTRSSGCCSRWSPSGRWSRGKLAATGWVAERVAIELVGVSDDQAYRGMDFLLDALDEIAAGVFTSVAHLLNLDLDIVFVDTTSTYWEVETADDDRELADPDADDELAQPGRGRGADVRALQGPPRRSAPGGDRDGGHPRRDPGAVLDLSRQHRRHRDHPHRQGRPGRVGAAPAGVGRRPRVRLRRQPRLPDPRRRALHPRREAAPHQHRGRRRAGPPRPLPHRGRQPAGQGSPRRTRRGR